MDLIQGQVEALMPAYLQARKDEEIAKQKLSIIKNQLLDIITTPQTIETTWGKLIRKKGARRIVPICKSTEARIKVLKAQIKAMEEEAVSDNRASVKNDNDHIEFRGN